MCKHLVFLPVCHSLWIFISFSSAAFVFVYSILCVPSVRSLFLVIATMRGKGWLTARLIITRWDEKWIRLATKRQTSKLEIYFKKPFFLYSAFWGCVLSLQPCDWRRWWVSVSLLFSGTVFSHLDKLCEDTTLEYINDFLFSSVVSALNKAWCVSCFSCSTCNTKLTLK